MLAVRFTSRPGGDKLAVCVGRPICKRLQQQMSTMQATATATCRWSSYSIYQGTLNETDMRRNVCTMLLKYSVLVGNKYNTVSRGRYMH